MGESNRKKSNATNAGRPSRPPVPPHLREFCDAGLRNQIAMQRTLAKGVSSVTFMQTLFAAVDIVHVTYPGPRIDHGIGYFVAKGMPLLRGGTARPDSKMVSLYVGSRGEAHALGVDFGDHKGEIRHG